MYSHFPFPKRVELSKPYNYNLNMAIQALNTIKKWFQTGLKPSQNQFWDTWDSFRHKLEKVPLEDVEELESKLNTKAEKTELDEHKNDNTAHSELFAAKEDKSQKGVALGYAPLDEFSKIAYQYLNIVDNLTSGGTTSILSAQQGVVLQNQIDSIRTLLSSDNPELDTFQKIADTIEQIQMSLDTILVNDLTTGGTTKALTAEMGKQLEASKEDKSQKGVADGYVPLDDFAKIANQYLTIINDLTTGGSESMLSAEQGIVLQNQIDSINTLLVSDNVDLDTIQEIVDAIEKVQISLNTILVNDLTTGGVTKALTAEMGKKLNKIKLTATIATDEETQITATVSEDNKVVSRSKLFNWWKWILSNVQTINGIWTFNSGIKVIGSRKGPGLVVVGTDLSIVPQFGAIERYTDGKLYNSDGVSRYRILDDRDTNNFILIKYKKLQETFLSIYSDKDYTEISQYNTETFTQYEVPPYVFENSFGHVVFKTLNSYYTSLNNDLLVAPISIRFEAYLCNSGGYKFSGNDSIRLFSTVVSNGEKIDTMHSNEIDISTGQTSSYYQGNFVTGSYLSFGEPTFDYLGNKISEEKRLYYLQNYSYTGQYANEYISSIPLYLEYRLSVEYKDKTNNIRENARTVASFTNHNVIIYKLQ
ncbi:hypothetical protein [Flavobacterium sp.]|uniref:hypothetical protein n=1 Tax=Flavobacterium sp. TaxID=239 RepID=UPI0031DD2944